MTKKIFLYIYLCETEVIITTEKDIFKIGDEIAIVDEKSNIIKNILFQGEISKDELDKILRGLDRGISLKIKDGKLSLVFNKETLIHREVIFNDIEIESVHFLVHAKLIMI